MSAKYMVQLLFSEGVEILKNQESPNDIEANSNKNK